jgi:glycosyltransferase involved in cell wall biosynthesis
LLDSETDNQYWRAAVQRDINVLPIRSKSRFSLQYVNSIIKAVKDNNIDIIHSHEYKSDILAVLVSRQIGIPIVTTAHGWITNSMKSKLYIWLGKQTFRFFDRVVAVSPKIRNEILKYGASSSKVELIYNAIVVEDYQPTNYKKGYLRQRFNIDDDVKIIGNVGRISPEKGQKEFIKAAAIVACNYEKVCFVVVGSGKDMPVVEKLVESLGIKDKVFFTGYESNVRPVFMDLDILALTSFTEGFPNVILEALCMDTAVLATDVGGVNDIVLDNMTGVLVQAGDIEAMSNGMLGLLTKGGDAEKMILNGKNRINNYFEFSQRVKKIEDLYEQVISNNK